MGPARPRSSALTEADEAIVVEFRRRTLLPLDDVLGCLRETIPALSRSALHRCLVRHGISRLPQDEEKTSKRKRFAETAIGYVHIDVCELRLAEGKLHMFLVLLCHSGLSIPYVADGGEADKTAGNGRGAVRGLSGSDRSGAGGCEARCLGAGLLHRPAAAG